MRHYHKGQVTAETAVMLTFVITALAFMSIYVQRATQGAMKGNTDGIGSQLSIKSGVPWETKSVQKNYEETDLVGKVKTTTDSCSRSWQGIGGAVATAPADCDAVAMGKGSGFSGMITNSN